MTLEEETHGLFLVAWQEKTLFWEEEVVHGEEGGQET
jgi:hypothetical protein